MKEIDFMNFDPDNKSGGNGNGIGFLRFEKNMEYRVRLVGGGLEFHKLFVAKGKPSLIVDGKVKDEAAKLLSEHYGKEIKPSYRCAMFIIDRADGRVKILEGGFSIFDAISNWSKAMDIKPGSGQGVDWQIKVTGDGVSGSNPRRYAVVGLAPTPFTDDEKKMLQQLKDEDKLKLPNYLKETPLDKVINEISGSKDSEPELQPASAGSSSDMEW